MLSIQVLGDKDMKMKYLNPNTMFVASGVADGAPLDPQAPPPQLRAEILDSVTGGVLASFIHEVTSTTYRNQWHLKRTYSAPGPLTHSMDGLYG